MLFPLYPSSPDSISSAYRNQTTNRRTGAYPSLQTSLCAFWMWAEGWVIVTLALLNSCLHALSLFSQANNNCRARGLDWVRSLKRCVTWGRNLNFKSGICPEKSCCLSSCSWKTAEIIIRTSSWITVNILKISEWEATKTKTVIGLIHQEGQQKHLNFLRILEEKECC